MPLAEPTPRDSSFGSPLKLSRLHWLRPEVVVEVPYLTWTADNLLRQVSYQAQREDKPARQVVRSIAHSARLGANQPFGSTGAARYHPLLWRRALLQQGCFLLSLSSRYRKPRKAEPRMRMQQHAIT
jgi:hypothetical protein